MEHALLDAGLEDLAEIATLAVSELVTNAIVHTGSPVQVRVLTAPGAVRVEVEDRGLQTPVRRVHADASGTGRGLALVDDTVGRWGVVELEDGKTVWFEVGAALPDPPRGAAAGPPPREPREQAVVQVVLLGVPLLMHAAWQEHAAALLREYLLHTLGDGPDVLDRHARASEALSLLEAQLPALALAQEADALLGGVVEPHATAERVVLEVPVGAVASFETLDDLLSRATAEAAQGHFLSPATQPEIQEMRRWLCREVTGQAGGAAPASPWTSPVDVRVRSADPATFGGEYADLADTDEARVVADETSVVVAVSAAAVALLGYSSAEELLGRRVITVVPERFRQAHVAGTTLNATSGRDALLDVPVRVPVVRADGSELEVEMLVAPTARPDGRCVFVARLARA